VKNILSMLKSRWMIIVLGIIAVAALPALWFVSSGMASETVKKFQERVEKDYKEVTASKVSYEVVSPTGEKILQKSADANHAMIEAYKAIGEELRARTDVVSKAATDLNTHDGNHKLLIEGLFPAPPQLEKESKPKDFARALLRTERPRLLGLIKAGMPPPPTEIAEVLTELVLTRREEIKQSQGRTELDTQETEALTKDLLNLRLSRYQSRAAEIQVYADTAIFDEVPADAVNTTVSLATAWDWQEKLWIEDDLLRAVAAVNGDSDKRGVPGSIVKRITRMSIEPAAYSPAAGTRDAVLDTKPYEAGSDRAPTNLGRSITGRISGPGSENRWYDIRNITVEFVADAKRLPAFVDALASTNFMTVVDADLAKVDPAVDLRDGFAYGEDPVVKATLTIETIWFREWREAWMPIDVKRAMAMDKEAPAAAASNAPSPRRGGAPRTPPRPGGGDDAPSGGRRGRGGSDDGGGGG